MSEHSQQFLQTLHKTKSVKRSLQALYNTGKSPEELAAIIEESSSVLPSLSNVGGNFEGYKLTKSQLHKRRFTDKKIEKIKNNDELAANIANHRRKLNIIDDIMAPFQSKEEPLEQLTKKRKNPTFGEEVADAVGEASGVNPASRLAKKAYNAITHSSSPTRTRLGGIEPEAVKETTNDDDTAVENDSTDNNLPDVTPEPSRAPAFQKFWNRPVSDFIKPPSGTPKKTTDASPFNGFVGGGDPLSVTDSTEAIYSTLEPREKPRRPPAERARDMAIQLASDAMMGVDVKESVFRAAVAETSNHVGSIPAIVSAASLIGALPRGYGETKADAAANLMYMGYQHLGGIEGMRNYAQSLWRQPSADNKTALLDADDDGDEQTRAYGSTARRGGEGEIPTQALPERNGIAAPLAVSNGRSNQIFYGDASATTRVSNDVQQILSPSQGPSPASQPENGRLAQRAFQNYSQDIQAPYAVRR
jgi:hypothetical protein